MANKIIDVICTDEYASAFLEVAHIVSPFTNFDKVEIVRTFTPTSVDLRPRVCGFNPITNNKVEVTTELHQTKGMQVVVAYLDENGNPIYKDSCWYFSFNWKGLMATAKSNRR